MTDARRRYRLHDLTIDSEIALDAVEVRGTATPALRVILDGSRTIPGAPPPGELVAHIDDPPYSFAIVAQDHDVVLRYQAACDCRLDAAAMTMRVTVDPTIAPAVVGNVVGSGALSFAAMRHGASIFHASAIALGDVAVVVLGEPASGKTTTAAELCLGGAVVLADDAVRVVTDTEGTRVWAGIPALRLRPAAAQALTAQVDGLSLAPPVEGRFILHPPAPPLEPVPLAAVLVTQVDQHRRAIALEPLSLREALVEALRHPRIGGFVDGRPLREHFDTSSRLVERVPFYRLRRPPSPVRPALAVRALREHLGA